MLEPLPDGVRIVRTVYAPRVDVYDAWVNPDRLRAWWGPPGIAVAGLEGELRVGGGYRIAMEAPGTERRHLVWQFREIVPGERLVYGWRWEDGPEAGPESTVTIHFRDAGEHTEIELVHTGIADPAVRENHGRGWIACLDGLARVL